MDTLLLVTFVALALALALWAKARRCSRRGGVGQCGRPAGWEFASEDDERRPRSFNKCPVTTPKKVWAKNGKCCDSWEGTSGCVDPVLDTPDWVCTPPKVWGKNGECCDSWEATGGCEKPKASPDLIARIRGVKLRQIDNPASYGAACAQSKGPNVTGRVQPPYSAKACYESAGRKPGVCLRGGDGRTWCAAPDSSSTGVGWRAALGAEADAAIIDRLGGRIGTWGCRADAVEWDICCAHPEGSAQKGCKYDKVWLGRGSPTPKATSS